MAASSSLALLRTSSIMALRRTMASRVDVCSSFTAWRGAMGCLQHCRQHHAPLFHPPGPAGSAHHHRLVQALAALHVCRLDVDAVRTALPAGTGVRIWTRMGHRGGHGAGAAHPCMSLKQLMQSMDFFSVENMM